MNGGTSTPQPSPPLDWLTCRARRAADAIGNRTRLGWTLDDIQAVHELQASVDALTELVASAVEERDLRVGVTGDPVSEWHAQARAVLGAS